MNETFESNDLFMIYSILVVGSCHLLTKLTKILGHLVIQLI